MKPCCLSPFVTKHVDFMIMQVDIHKEFGKYALIRARRQQFIKMNALIVSRKFVGDIMQ